MIKFLLIFLVFILSCTTPKKEPVIYGVSASTEYWKKYAPPSLQLVESLLKWSEYYEVPYLYARRCAFLETGYKGPTDFFYNHARTSSAKAEGSMQVLLSTARFIHPEEIFTRADLRENIDLNTHISMRYARHLYDAYGRWILVWSYYNQGGDGLKNINNYARYIVSSRKI